MLKLMRLELKRNNIGAYIIAVFVSFLALVGLIYLIAYAAETENEVEFQNYKNIFWFTSTMSLVIFSVLSAVMYSRFVIGEYSGKRLALLFSYPVSHKKILSAKLLVVILFNVLAMLLCNLFVLAIFCATESISPIVDDTLTRGLFISAVQTIVTSVAATVAVGLVSMRIGFIKKSVPTTLVTSFILIGLVGNVTFFTIDGNVFINLGIIAATVVAAGAVIVNMTKKINRMEAE